MVKPGGGSVNMSPRQQRAVFPHHCQQVLAQVGMVSFTESNTMAYDVMRYQPTAGVPIGIAG